MNREERVRGLQIEPRKCGTHGPRSTLHKVMYFDTQPAGYTVGIGIGELVVDS